MGDFALLQTVFRRIVKVYDKNMFKNQVIFIRPLPLLLGFLCYRLSNLFITDTKGTKSSVCIREVRNCVKLFKRCLDSTYPVDKSLSSGKCDWFPNTSLLGSDLSSG